MIESVDRDGINPPFPFKDDDTERDIRGVTERPRPFSDDTKTESFYKIQREYFRSLEVYLKKV